MENSKDSILDYLKSEESNGIFNELSSLLDLDINKIKTGNVESSDFDGIKKIVKENKNLFSINSKDAERIKDTLENNPKEFEKNFLRRVDSDLKKTERGENSKSSFIKSLADSLLLKKPSKSKYTRKKRKK